MSVIIVPSKAIRWVILCVCCKSRCAHHSKHKYYHQEHANNFLHDKLLSKNNFLGVLLAGFLSRYTRNKNIDNCWIRKAHSQYLYYTTFGNLSKLVYVYLNYQKNRCLLVIFAKKHLFLIFIYTYSSLYSLLLLICLI